MKVLVTGGCGFIGSHVVEELLSNGNKVSIVGKTCNLGNIKSFLDKVSFYKGDVRNAKFISNLVKRNDTVVHMAAQVNVDLSIQNPWIFWDVNVFGTFNILEAIRKYNKKLVFMSTCEAYGEVSNGKADETHPTNPKSPYAVSKLCADRYCYTYYLTYGLPITIIRSFNVYGPRQSYGVGGAVIPKFIKTVMSDKSPTIFGDGSQIRDYVYVKDVAHGIATAASQDFQGEIINLATGRGTKIKDVAYQIVKESGKEDSLEPQFVKGRPGELMRSIGNASKAKKLLDWKPKVNFKKGLKNTFDSFKNYID